MLFPLIYCETMSESIRDQIAACSVKDKMNNSLKYASSGKYLLVYRMHKLYVQCLCLIENLKSFVLITDLAHRLKMCTQFFWVVTQNSLICRKNFL